MRSALACCLLVFISHAPLTAKPLAPVAKWRVDFGDSHCIAERIYGEPRKPVYLHLKAPPVGDGIQLTISEKGPRRDGIQEAAKLTIGSHAPLQLSQLRYGGEGQHVRMVNLAKDQVEQLASAGQLRWSGPHIDDTFELGPMAELVKVIEKCRLGLADLWNASPDKKAALRQTSTMNTTVRRLFSSDDYPSQAVMKSQSGTANVVALVDEQGKMVDCTVIETSGIAVLDAQTCIMIRKRGKFLPAVGADGRPAKSVFTQRVHWQMP